MASRPAATRLLFVAIALAVLAGIIHLLGNGAPDEAPDADRTGELPPATVPETPSIEPTVDREAAAVEPEGPTEHLTGVTHDPDSATRGAVRLTLLPEPPPFVSQDPMAGAAQNAVAREPAVITAVELEGDTFRLRGPRLVGYLAPEDPFVVARNAVFVDARESERAHELILEPAGVLRGLVRGPDGKPLADAAIRVQSKVGIDVAFVRSPIRKTAATKSSADGTFVIEHVPAQVEFDLSVEAKSFLKQWRSIRVEAKGTTEVTIDLGSGARLAGRVRRANGDPVEGATVSVSEAVMRVDPQAPQRADVATLTARTGADGRFEMAGLNPGKYVASATHPDFARAMLDPFDVPREGLALRDDLVLIEGLRIRGRVIDATGAPVANTALGVRASSALTASGLGLTPDSVEMMGGRGFSGAPDGSFESPPLEAGDYDVVAVASGFKKAFQSKVRAGADGVTLTLHGNGAIEGVVIDFENSTPVTQFHVAALRPFDFSKLTDPETFEPVRHAVVTSAKGRYRLEDLSEGEYDVSIVAEGLARTTIEHVAVKSGQTTHAVNFFLRPEATISGTIIEEGTARPVAGARLTTRHGFDAMQPDPLASESEALSDTEGRFVLRGLAAGRYTLAATARGFAPGSAGPIDLNEAEHRTDVTIALTRGGVIRGSVIDARNAPVVGAMISATRGGMISPNMTVTDSSGLYRLEGLPPGTYSVTKLAAFSVGAKDAAADMLRGMMTKTARVEDGKEIVLDFVEERIGTVTLSGRVLVADQPSSGVLLHFVREDAGAGDADGADPDDEDGAAAFHLATTDAAGRYEIDTLTPGKWDVVVQSSVELSAASRQNFEIELGPALEQVHDFVISRTGIEGIVVRRGDRKPVPGARVSVDALDDDAGLDPFSKRLGSKRVSELFADENGRFKASGLAPGRYRIVAGGTGILNLGGGNFARSAPREIRLAEGQVFDGLEFELEPGASIRGTVIANGKGIEGAAIFFVRDGEASSIDPFATTMTDGAGSYLADGLEPGSYLVAAKAPGFAPSWRGGNVVRQNEVTTVDLSVVEGSPFLVTVVDASGADVTTECSLRFKTPEGLDLSDLRSFQDLMEVALGSETRPALRLAAGDYDVVVVRGEKSKTVRVAHGAVSRHVIALE